MEGCNSRLRHPIFVYQDSPIFVGSTSHDEALFDASHDEERQHLTAGYITANWQLSPSWSARTELRVENTDFAYILNGEKVAEQSKSLRIGFHT